MRRITGLILALAGSAVAAHSVAAQDAPKTAAAQTAASEKEAEEQRKERFANWTRAYVEQTTIAIPSDKEPREAERVPNPVFQYSDEERGIRYATLWVWTRDARPVALQKVEAQGFRRNPQWTICLASLSEGLLEAKWPAERRYAATEPGVKFSAIPKADRPAESARLRTAQIKLLKDRFTGRIESERDGTKGGEARIITKPIYEYFDPASKLPMGAIFGMSSVGTNPDMLLVIEARPGPDGQPRWEYGLSRMTRGSILLRLDDEEVLWQEAVPIVNAVFANWTFYHLRRDLE